MAFALKNHMDVFDHICSSVQTLSFMLLSIWDPPFSWAHRETAAHIWSLLECAVHGRSSQYGTRRFPGLTANPQHTFGPSWSVRRMAAPRSAGPAVFRAHRLPTTLINYSQHSAKRKLSLISLVPKCQHKHNGTHAARPYKTTKVVKPKSTVDKQWRHTSKNSAALTRPTLWLQ